MTAGSKSIPNRLPRRWRRGLLTAGKVALLGLALWLVWRLLGDLDWQDLADRMEGAEPGWLVAAAAALVVRFAIWDERWRRVIVRVGPAPPRLLSLASLVAAATVNTITPTARVLGGVMRARHLSKALDQPMGRAYGSVLYDQVAHQTVSGVLTWLSLIAAAALTGRPRVALLLTVLLVLSALLLALWLGRRRNGNGNALVRWLADRITGTGGDGDGSAEADEDGEETGGELSRLQRLLSHGREAVGVVRRLLSDGRLAFEAMVLGLAFFVVNASGQWFVFRALDSPVGFAVTLAVVALGAIAGVAVGTPGGVGGAEAAMIAAFTAFGVPPLDAAAGALLYRAFHFATILALGAPSLVWLEVKLGRRSGRTPS